MKLAYLSLSFLIANFGAEASHGYYELKDGRVDLSHSGSAVRLEMIPKGVEVLDLKGHREVDDAFIRRLAESDVAKRIARLDLSGTRVTREGLVSILTSQKLGTERSLPSISERYGQHASTVYATTDLDDVSKEDFSKPIGGLMLEYKHPLTGARMSESQRGIKFLNLDISRSHK
jgi:hypothetical protein